MAPRYPNTSTVVAANTSSSMAMVALAESLPPAEEVFALGGGGHGGWRGSFARQGSGAESGRCVSV